MSDAPRTDAHIKEPEPSQSLISFARQLERELTQVRGERDDIKKQYMDYAFKVDRTLSQHNALRQQLAVAELKNRGTLANNLCPDHRDKQGGKKCLACEIEHLNKQLADWQRVATELSDSIQRVEITKTEAMEYGYKNPRLICGCEICQRSYKLCPATQSQLIQELRGKALTAYNQLSKP